MFILKTRKRFCALFSFKFLILLLICILVLNLFLFYHLKSISYIQTTVHVLQNRQTFLEQEKNKTDEHINKVVEKISCKTGNFSLLVSDVILQLNEDLEDLYLTSPNNTILFQRCHTFLRTLDVYEGNTVFVTKDQIDFRSKKLLTALKKSTVVKIENAPKGTQLKLLVHLTNNITAIVKPKWYTPFDIITGPVYAGKDRHYGEVLAFFISILLDIPRVPPATVRIFDLQKEIISVADQKLRSTFILKDNNTCFYGVCPYCNPADLLCTDSKVLEGTVIYYLSSQFQLKLMRHPWRRTYRCSVLARWEIDEHYCAAVQHSKFYSSPRNRDLFLDFIDVAIFDFLISNGDRHHYEYIEKSKKPRILIMDNGKSFGNPYADHVDILAPLYQCCTLRNSTWNNLLQLRGGNLSKWLRYLIKNSDADVLTNKMHYEALDRRLLLTFATLKYCFKKIGIQNVIVDE